MYKKTFKRRGFYMGFKLGDGMFRSFVFDIPSIKEKKVGFDGGEEVK